MKNLLVLVLLPLFLLPVAQTGNAQDAVQNPELAGLVEKALNHYPRFRELLAAEQSAAVRIDIARSQYLPSVQSEASFRYQDPIAEASFGPPGNEQKVQFQPKDNYNVQVGGTGLIFDFGRTKAQVARALADAETSSAATLSLRQTIAFQVAQLYYGLVYTHQAQTVQQDQLTSLQANLDQVSKRYDNGDALELDLLNARLALANARNRLADLQAQADKQQALLTVLTGENTPVTATTFDFQQDPEGDNTGSNADVLLARARIAAAEQDMAVNKHFLRPSLTYNGALGFRNGYQPDITEFRFNWAAGVGFVYPLYVGGRDRLQLKLSRIAIESARAAAETTASILAGDLLQARADARAAAAKLENAAVIVEQANTTVVLARTRFNNGVATNVDVLTAENNLQLARLAELQARYQRTLAVLQIRKALGLKIP